MELLNSRLRGLDTFLVNGEPVELFKKESDLNKLYFEKIKTEEVLLLFRLDSNGKLTGIYCNGLDGK